jgi:tRNA (guanine37-N1)-methyltransferase
MSGNHAEIARWRREQSILRTLKKRPELLENAPLSDKEIKFIKKIKEQGDGS